MGDVLIVAAFIGMVLSPCVVASHASMQQDDGSLGYVASLRRVRGRLIEKLRV